MCVCVCVWGGGVIGGRGGGWSVKIDLALLKIHFRKGIDVLESKLEVRKGISLVENGVTETSVSNALKVSIIFIIWNKIYLYIIPQLFGRSKFMYCFTSILFVLWE